MMNELESARSNESEATAISKYITAQDQSNFTETPKIICIEKKNQLDAPEWFIAPIIRSTCFQNFYAHHQELETICVLLPPIVCSA